MNACKVLSRDSISAEGEATMTEFMGDRELTIEITTIFSDTYIRK